MFCSTIIPTIGRSSLARAVESVLEQEFTAADFEVIVVNDSGEPLPSAPWQQAERVRLVTTHGHERGVARNVGAALARGQYLHFLDDDDWLLPGALQIWWRLSHRHADCAWLHGGTQLVDRQAEPVIELRLDVEGNCLVQVIAGEWIPLQSSIINADSFFAVGGFATHIPGIEDVDLCRRLLLHEQVAGTQTPVAVVGMGEEGSTTNRQRAQEDGRRARERVLENPNAWSRLHASATNHYWRGRITRAYLTSTVWNLQDGQYFLSASRLLYALLSLLVAGRALFSLDFWRAVTGAHHSFAFAAGFAAQDRTPA